ncbi:hypothetical protein NEDG_01722 [Nematocida displodere]|uniref:FHA domain-containing protein n=1 Tax=Nematocida displodere TaxID=1805483 RepID=A0A177EGL9_9MICR|nr:hypothetical protein NEDG_01722 [Nematocida displodere]
MNTPPNTKYTLELLTSNEAKKIDILQDTCTIGSMSDADVKITGVSSCMIDYKTDSLHILNGTIVLNGKTLTDTEVITYPSIISIEHNTFKIDKLDQALGETGSLSSETIAIESERSIEPFFTVCDGKEMKKYEEEMHTDEADEMSLTNSDESTSDSLCKSMTEKEFCTIQQLATELVMGAMQKTEEELEPETRSDELPEPSVRTSIFGIIPYETATISSEITDEMTIGGSTALPQPEPHHMHPLIDGSELDFTLNDPNLTLTPSKTHKILIPTTTTTEPASTTTTTATEPAITSTTEPATTTTATEPAITSTTTTTEPAITSTTTATATATTSTTTTTTTTTATEPAITSTTTTTEPATTTNEYVCANAEPEAEINIPNTPSKPKRRASISHQMCEITRKRTTDEITIAPKKVKKSKQGKKAKQTKQSRSAGK